MHRQTLLLTKENPEDEVCRQLKFPLDELLREILMSRQPPSIPHLLLLPPPPTCFSLYARVAFSPHSRCLASRSGYRSFGVSKAEGRSCRSRLELCMEWVLRMKWSSSRCLTAAAFLEVISRSCISAFRASVGHPTMIQSCWTEMRKSTDWSCNVSECSR